jgi:hypothetical protein
LNSAIEWAGSMFQVVVVVVVGAVLGVALAMLEVMG